MKAKNGTVTTGSDSRCQMNIERFFRILLLNQSTKNCNDVILKIPPNFEGVATLPCEI